MALRLQKSNDIFREELEEAKTFLSNKKEWVLKSQTHYEIDVPVSLTGSFDPFWLSLEVSLPCCWLQEEDSEVNVSEIHSWPIILRSEGEGFGLNPPDQWPKAFYEKAVERVRDEIDDFLRRCPDPFGRKAGDFRITLV